AILHRGQLTATVEESGRGFTIETLHADIIDLGTRFGVEVDEAGEADVVVFDGRVDIDYRQPQDGGSGPTQRKSRRVHALVHGEAIRIVGSEKFFYYPTIREGMEAHQWSLVLTEANSSLIAGL